jgi:prepilin-type N-terminal cleavage/methylation domain-containing protein
MKRLIKRGFTLIELMIVLAIIGVLSVVLIPKALPLKNQAKNNAVQANVYMARSFLENRVGADRISISSSNTSIDNTLGLVKDDIASKMNITFSGSSEMRNPFNNNTIINSANSNIQNNNPENSSVVIGYDTNSMPTNLSSITNTVVTPGVTAIIVYQTGYVVYGVDNSGGIMQPTLINMPKVVAQLPITFQNPSQPQPTMQQVATPTFSYSFDGTGGSYTISCTTPNATILYTTDGSQPDKLSSEYNGPINVTTSTTITAYAIYSGMTDSNIASIIYTSPSLNYGLDNKNSNFMSVWYKPIGASSVILHYKVNSVSQSDVTMSFNNSLARWESGQVKLNNKLKSNDVTIYSFTYIISGVTYNSPWYSSIYYGK